MFQTEENVKQAMRSLNLNGHVGFDSMPDQLTHKSAQNGFVFNILCIGKHICCSRCFASSKTVIRHTSFTLGETGLGKSTLMDSLFNTNFESTPSTHNLPNVKLKAHTYELQESNVQLKVKTIFPGTILCFILFI